MEKKNETQPEWFEYQLKNNPMEKKTITIKDVEKEIMKRRPKTYKKAKERWDVRMIPDMVYFVVGIAKLIDWEERTYDGLEIEVRLEKLLARARRLK